MYWWVFFLPIVVVVVDFFGVEMSERDASERVQNLHNFRFRLAFPPEILWDFFRSRPAIREAAERRNWLITWRSGAVLGCARSHADNHGFILDNNDVDAAGDVSYFALSSRLLNNLPLILLWLCCWLVLLWAPEINASATITTNLGPGRILTGS